ncbi:uncharacterized protein LOC130674885 [Microplitis mediator]|uniref:uncharacterized protein LOC130674885 n=1 Tax=Microplitis mediator TaxID=375433 RepID=UPI002557BA79|nr:uncharacterized protein LOC130674885 [Microplitis mediator]
MDKNKLRPDLQGIVNKFVDLSVEHCALKKNLNAQEEIVDLFNMNANKAQERLDKLIPAVEKYYENKEREVRNLKRQIRNLEDEKEIIQCDKTIIEEKHREEMGNLNKKYQNELMNLKKKYDEEINELKILVDSQKITIKKLTEEIKKNGDFVHPALYETITGGNKKRPKSKKKTAQVFDWPSLDIELSQSDKNNETVVEKKRRKLYTPSEEPIVDLD